MRKFSKALGVAAIAASTTSWIAREEPTTRSLRLLPAGRSIAGISTPDFSGCTANSFMPSPSQ